MRERLDRMDISSVRQAIHDVIGIVQRSQALQDWDFMGTKLISLDGTGFFFSASIHCENCCERTWQNGKVSYEHQMLVGSIVNPYHKQVFPVLFEPICKEDGALKNDCERNAAKRWLRTYRSFYPNMPTTIVEDGIASNAPHIQALKEARCHFILGAKADDHKYLYEWFCAGQAPEVTELTEVSGHFQRYYRFMNHVPLNETNFDLKVNVLLFEEEELPHMTTRGKMKKKPKPKRCWVWVTDYEITSSNIRDLARGGRARWKIENETFKVLKTQEYYHFEHNYGHGYKNLSNILAGVMLLAFLVDQVLLAFNREMQQAFEKMSQTYSYLWEKVRSLFNEWRINSLESLYLAIFHPPPKPVL